MKKSVTVKLETTLVEQIDFITGKLSITRTHAFEAAVIEWLKYMRQKRPDFFEANAK